MESRVAFVIAFSLSKRTVVAPVWPRHWLPLELVEIDPACTLLMVTLVTGFNVVFSDEKRNES
jgi:hypothetical protein